MQKVFMGKSKNVANGSAAGSSELEDGNTYYDYIWDDNPSWPLLAAGKVNQTGWAPKTVLTNIITHTHTQKTRYLLTSALWKTVIDLLFFTFAVLCWPEWLGFTFPLNWQLIGCLWRCAAPLPCWRLEQIPFWQSESYVLSPTGGEIAGCQMWWCHLEREFWLGDAFIVDLRSSLPLEGGFALF